MVLRVIMIPGTTSTQALVEGPSSTEHVVQRAVAPLVYYVVLGVVGGGEDLLNPKRAQELGPNGADKLPTSIGEKSSGRAKVGDDMPYEGLTNCACGLITGGDGDGVFGEAVHGDNQELMASIGR